MTSNTDIHNSSEPQTNPRGIPVAPFVDKVEDYVSSRKEVEPALKKFQEMIAYDTPRVIVTFVVDDGGRFFHSQIAFSPY